MNLIHYSALIFIFLSADIYADVFKLKSGEVIEGEVVSADEKAINVKVKYGTIKIDKSEIIPEQAEIQKKPVRPVRKGRRVSGPLLVTQERISGMKRWLEGQIHPKTGLLESYRPTSDAFLDKQAATYDQALAGLSFIILGDMKKAQAILDFYKAKWDGKGFSNFYFTPTGNPGIEGTRHLGPNLWIALLALHYDRAAAKSQYQKLAEDIVRWAMGLPHYMGGAAMSNLDEWRAPWSKVVSTENNIDYYAVLSILEGRIRDPKLADKIRREKFGIIDFLRKTVYDMEGGGIYRGFHEGVVDREYALDTITWLAAAVGIGELRNWGIDTEKLITSAEQRFLVSDEGIKGFDFTDERGAFKAKRARMISIEWTFGMINLYCIYRDYYNKLASEQAGFGNIKKARELYKRVNILDNKAKFFSREMDKKLLRFGPKEDMYAYPYATRSYWLVFYDSPWWKTPKPDAGGTPAGSVASTTWRIFAGWFNPLKHDGAME